MNGDSVLRAAEASRDFLLPMTGRDWAAISPPGMDWTVAKTVAHIAECLTWYANDLAAGDRELSTVEIQVRPETSPPDLVATLSTWATVLAGVVDTVPAGARGWHPYGRADASGFAAMACDELLLHTSDVARAVDAPFTPPPGLAEATLHRLFPWAPPGHDPWTTLLWANGRADLPDHPAPTHWRWHCAPLSEWNGTNPARP